MNNQMGEMIGKFQPFRPGFCGDGFPRHDDIAEKRAELASMKRRCGERQDVGRGVLVTILPIEQPDMGIVGEHQGNLGVVGDLRQIGRPAGGKGAIDESLKIGLRRPAIGLDQDVGTDARTAGVWRQGQIPSPGVRSDRS